MASQQINNAASLVSYDFSAPYAAASIYNVDTRVLVPLWTSANYASTSVLGRAVTVKGLSYVTEISVSTYLSTLPTIQVHLSMPYRDGIDLLNSDLLEFNRSNIIVDFGYVSGITGGTSFTKSVAALMLLPQVNFSAEGIDITLNGRGSFSVDASCRYLTIPGVTRREVFEALASGPDPANPRKLTVDFTVANQDKTVSAILDAELGSYGASGMSDWHAMRQLAEECRCYLYVVGGGTVTNDSGSTETGSDKILLLPHASLFGNIPTKTFTMMAPQSIGAKTGIYPILNASVPSTQQYLAKEIRGIATKGIDSEDRTYSQTLVEDDGFPRLGVANSGVKSSNGPSRSCWFPYVDPGSLDGTRHLPDTPEDPDRVAKIQAAYAAMAPQTYGLNVNLDTLGIPDIIPGEVVVVQGLSDRIDATYGVYKVTHTLEEGGFTTHLECWSNTTAMQQANADPVVKDPNTQAAAPQGGSKDVTATEVEDE